MKCGSTIINVVTGERYWDRRTETRPIVFPAKKWSSLQFFHFVGVSDGTDFVRIRHIFYSVQQVKLTTVWELRKYWQTLNVQKNLVDWQQTLPTKLFRTHELFLPIG
jgi:hypothetical protein